MHGPMYNTIIYCQVPRYLKTNTFFQRNILWQCLMKSHYNPYWSECHSSILCKYYGFQLKNWALHIVVLILNVKPL